MLCYLNLGVLYTYNIDHVKVKFFFCNCQTSNYISLGILILRTREYFFLSVFINTVTTTVIIIVMWQLL